jgi:DNA repair exonuclease SbcCD nuclease subunit
MTRFLHTADWQIGKPYLSVEDDRKRILLQQERLQAIGRIGEVARSHAVSFVLVAGDLFDSPTVPNAAVMEVMEAIGSLELPVLVIPGNHDHGAAGSLWFREDLRRQQRQRAPNLQLLLERQPLELDTALLLPCPLLRRRESQDPCAWITALDWSQLPPHKPRIVLAHGGVQGFGGRDYEAGQDGADAGGNQLDLGRLPEAEIDYIALGDWHNLRQVSPRAWYCGTPEPDRFDQGADNQRGQVLVVEAGRAVLPAVTVAATGRLGWHNLAVHFNQDDDLDRFAGRLETLLDGRVARDLLRLEVSGSLSLAGQRRYEALIEELRDQLLRLRLKGQCQAAPQAAELQALTERPADPLIAAVAGQLRQRLDQQLAAGDGAAAITRAALCQLHALVAMHGAETAS